MMSLKLIHLWELLYYWNEKHKKCYFSYEQRKQLLEAIRYVDLVIPENSWEQKVSDMHEYHIDTFVMGDDWKGKFDYLDEYCKVVYLDRTEGVSSSEIRENPLAKPKKEGYNATVNR